MGDNQDSLSIIKNLYENLSKGFFISNWIKFGNRFASLTMHKSIEIPIEKRLNYSKRNRDHYINDLLLEALDFPKEPIILDAGCGFGGTIFRWFDKIGGKYDGLTLSPTQVKVGRREANIKGVSQRCHFLLQSFDQTLKKSYDVIVAIESLIHSPNLTNTIANLSQALKVGGQLIVVDDIFYSKDVEQSPDYQKLRDCWFLNQVAAESMYVAAFKKNNLEVVSRIDLTDQVIVAEKKRLKLNEKLFTYLKYSFPSKTVKSYLTSQIGGIALQRLYHAKCVNYLLYIVKKVSG